VHQGDLDGVKGIYHINAVDEVTQWEVVGATAQISEAWLLPVLEAMLQQFPFRIRGFHSDNGSEFINHTVAQLLNKLLVEQTKSRPRHSNDNGLAETKNGWVIRNTLATATSARRMRKRSTSSSASNPYLNFHRPCGVPELVTNAKRQQKRRYGWYATPFEILRQLPGVAGFLRADLTLHQLAHEAATKSDTRFRDRDAGSQTKTVQQNPSAERVNQIERAMEMTDGWKTRKTKTRFPYVSHRPWIRSGPTFPQPRFVFSISKPNQEGKPKPRIAPLPRSGSSFDEKMLFFPP